MRNRFWRIAALVAGVAVVAGGAGTAYAAMSGSGPSYRLATATPAAVTAALQEVGTLAPVNQADVAFPVTGAVKSVDVVAGQHVAAGQKLGSLDTTALEASLSSAKEDLANANLQVSSDLASEDNAGSGSGSAGGSGSSPSSPGSPSSPSASLTATLRPLQEAVLGGQRRVDGALAQAKTALADAKAACAAQSGSGPGPSPTPTPTPTPAPTPTPTPASTRQGGRGAASTSTSASAATSGSGSSAGAPGPGPSTSLTCAAATNQVLDDETAVLRAEQTLSRRLTALDQALVKAIAGDAGGGSGGTGTGGSGGTGGTGVSDAPGVSRSGGNGAGGGGETAGGGGGPVSAAQLAADQASADAAAAQVTVAEANLADARVVSPIAGTVLSVSAQAGEMETGGTAFVIAGLHSYQVVADVPVTDMPQLKVGDPASVRPDGSSSGLPGTVVSIGLIPDSSSSPATYPVTIGLASQPAGLHPDALATVTITTAHSTGVSVPTSAVHGSGKKATVTAYSGGKARAVKVTIGTMGPVMTRITAGLRPGEKVVLANLNQPLPNNNPNTGPGPGGPGSGVVRLAPGPQFVGG